MKFGLLRKWNYEKVFCEPVTYYLQITFLDNMIVFESCHCPIWMVESIFFRKQLKICFSRNISRGLWLYLPLEQKCYNEIDIWDKVFKNGLSKFCGRQPLKKLLSPLLSHMCVNLYCCYLILMRRFNNRSLFWCSKFQIDLFN